MGLYADYIEPRLVSCACSAGILSKYRSRLVPEASGRVLEIGFGSGNNAPFYDPSKIDHLYALEPNAGWRRLGQKRLDALPFSAEWLELPGEEIPLGESSVDTVLVTFALCTIPGVEAAIAGMRRVLRPSGQLLFLEHGAAPDAGVAKWQRRIEPIWGKLAGGCRLTRSPDQLVQQQGFQIENLTQLYAPKMPKIAGYVSAGVARK